MYSYFHNVVREEAAGWRQRALVCDGCSPNLNDGSSQQQLAEPEDPPIR